MILIDSIPSRRPRLPTIFTHFFNVSHWNNFRGTPKLAGTFKMYAILSQNGQKVAILIHLCSHWINGRHEILSKPTVNRIPSQYQNMKIILQSKLWWFFGHHTEFIKLAAYLDFGILIIMRDGLCRDGKFFLYPLYVYMDYSFANNTNLVQVVIAQLLFIALQYIK